MGKDYLIYDIHSHLGKTSSGEENTPEEMLADLDAYGISKVGISSLSGTSMRAQNDLVHRAKQAHPDQIKNYAFINPKAPDAIDEVHRCLGELKMDGVKFHSWKHGYYPDNTPALQEIFEAIEPYGVHVQMHVGTAPFSTPYTWAVWAKRFPKIDFLFTHIGYYEFGQSTIEAVRDLSNVWVETSGQMDVDVLLRAIDVLGERRVCFGTDWPYKPVNIEVEKFFELEIPSDKLEFIFHRNAEYLWRMEG
ncbi:amidohydrolase family protein [Enorma phocaeensis]|uniref:amidohydrolase family protein n=1 Tax=Enorma phocaeensis TaxID=1871019 RepID=UPI00195C691D|nr:amidohydrolase family protein [Enorma phocaeensis]MBM6953602.1 amidohydrolase [Enorma phocaeensis]